MSVQVTVRYWAGARRAAGLDSEQLTGTTVGDLLGQLRRRPALAPVLAASSLLVDSAAGSELTVLHPGSVVDVLPPFAGG